MAPQPVKLLLSSVPVAALVAATLALAGCGGSSPAASGPNSASASASSAPASSATASAAATTTASGEPAAAPPAGYQWVGITAQHIWLAVPDSWVVLNLNSLSVQQAMDRVKLKGSSASQLRADIQNLKQDHALMVMDTASVATSPNKFATNINTFCATAPIKPGPGAASAIESGIKTEYTKIGGHVISMHAVTDTSAAVIVKIEVDLQSASGITAHELQYVDLTSSGQVCYTTFTTDRPATFFPQFEKIAATIHTS